MVRSILTVNPARTSRKYLAAIVKPTISFMLDWTSAPDLKVSDDFVHVFRDFSLTTRIGELAQGVSVAFWRWERGYLLCTDFGPWAAGLQPPYPGAKSPDFVIYNPMTNDMAVMEVKGTSSDDYKVPMGQALRQIKDAVAHPAFNRGYGCVLTLSTTATGGKGILHVRDPEKPTELPENLAYYIFRRSYASWFELVGDDELAKWCRQLFDGTTGVTMAKDRINLAGNNENVQLRQMIAGALGFQPDLPSFQIDPAVVDALENPKKFSEIPWETFGRNQKDTPSGSQTGMSYPDGTMIIER